MKSFLSHIADQITLEDIPHLADWCYVFPSKRSGIFYADILQKKFKGHVYWSPEILGIEDFVYKNTDRIPSDDISLVFKLYKVYKVLEPNLDFEKFYSWGEILLSDFDEIDRNLVNSKELYEGLKDFTQIEETFGDSEEVLKAYGEFIQLFSDNPETELIRRFTRNWRKIYQVYKRFNEAIETDNSWYKGKLFKKLAEDMSGDSYALPYKKVIFAGFNALSRSEEQIILTLLENGTGEIYWDSDKLYMANDLEEAGYFLRNYKKRWKYTGVHWVETNMLEDDKEIQFIGCPKLVTQSKFAGKIVKENDLSTSGTDTALVLSDENMLIPVLHSVNTPEVNVTMGYPFRNTSLYQFITEVIRLQQEGVQRSDDTYSGDQVLVLLKNTLVSPVFTQKSERIASWIRKEKMRRVSSAELLKLCGDSWLKLIFLSTDDAFRLLDNVSQFLVKLFYFLKDSAQAEENLTSTEIVYHGVKNLQRFSENLRDQEFRPSLRFLSKLFQESFRSLKIPFSGEPLAGLQIMGFLETRALDFKNVVILGANENKIPRTTLGQTYIPYIARKAFGLPTFEEQEAIYAYHFKRLIQRAEKVYIIYDTEVGVDGSGEKSRFLRQLLYRTRSSKSKLKVVEKTVIVPFSSPEDPKAITITKTDDVLARLDRFVSTGQEDHPVLSPTALVTYIDCKLRFYLRYVARVPEVEAGMEEIDRRVFGQILHLALEKVYKPYVGMILEEENLREMARKDSIQQAVRTALEELSLIRKGYGLGGKDLLMESVIRRLILKVLEKDMQSAPIELIDVEKRLRVDIKLSNGIKVSLGGVVDRIDRIQHGSEDFVRVIDYKSGKVDMLGPTKANIEDPEEYLQPYFEDGRYRSGFQAYYYTALMRGMNGNSTYKSAIYELRKMSSGMRYLRSGKEIPRELLESFSRKTRKLVEEIYNPGISFSQTEDIKKCVFCPYNTICER